MSDMPEEVKAWRSIPLVDHCGTWSETRYPEEAIVYIRADLIDMDVLRRVETLIDKMAAAWFVAAQNNKGEHMTLGEIGALAKHHLDVTALRCSESTLADLRAMMEKINE